MLLLIRRRRLLDQYILSVVWRSLYMLVMDWVRRCGDVGNNQIPLSPRILPSERYITTFSIKGILWSVSHDVARCPDPVMDTTTSS